MNDDKLTIDGTATEIHDEPQSTPLTPVDAPESQPFERKGETDAVIVDGVLYGADAHVATWVQERLGGELVKVPFVAFGAIENGRLVAGAYYHSYHDNTFQRDITITVAFDDAHLNPGTVARVFDYPFGQLKLPRMTAEIAMSNERAVRQAQLLGFKLEGKKRKATGDGGEIGIFGLLADECRIWQRRKQD